MRMSLEELLVEALVEEETPTASSETAGSIADSTLAQDKRVKQMLQCISRLHNMVLGTENYHQNMIEAREILDRYKQ